MTETKQKPTNKAKTPQGRKKVAVKKEAEPKKSEAEKSKVEPTKNAEKQVEAEKSEKKPANNPKLQPPESVAAALPQPPSAGALVPVDGEPRFGNPQPAIRPSTKKAREQGGKDGREQKKVYYYYKKLALVKEPENFSKLMIVREKGDWWKMMGHSAVLFYYDVSKWVDFSCKLVPDTDFDYRSEEGIINIKDIWKLDEKLTAAKVNLIQSTENVRIYNIGKKYTLADIEAYKKEKKMEWARVNKIIVPRNVLPSLYTSLRELLGRVYHTTKRMEGYAREVVGQPMFETVTRLIEEYSKMTAGTGMQLDEYLEEVTRGMDTVVGKMAIISELKIIELQRIYQILRAAEKVRRDVEKCQQKTP